MHEDKNLLNFQKFNVNVNESNASGIPTTTFSPMNNEPPPRKLSKNKTMPPQQTGGGFVDYARTSFHQQHNSLSSVDSEEDSSDEDADSLEEEMARTKSGVPILVNRLSQGSVTSQAKGMIHSSDDSDDSEAVDNV